MSHRLMKAVISLLVLSFSGACGGSTSGGFISLPFKAGGMDRPGSGPLGFSTPAGWDVSLEQARINLGPFYFNLSPPPTNAFRGGTVIIQATTQIILDPLNPSLIEVPGGADGVTGAAVAAELGLLPADKNASESSADLVLVGNHIGVVSGTATRGAEVIRFAGPIDIDTSLVTPQLPLQALQRVNGAAVNLSFSASSQTLVLRVDPTHWFDATDFSGLADTAPPGGVRTWTVHTTFLRHLLQGVQSQTGVYEFSLTSGGD